MFSQIFDFSVRRTPLNALGWYIVFVVLGVLLVIAAAGLIIAMAIVTGGNLSSAVGTGMSGPFKSGVSIGEYLNIAYTSIVAILLLMKKQKSPLNVALYVLSVVLSILLGAIPALIPLAVTTTRP
ncbi:MAG: hypothetical protein P4L98_09460 [Ancalomicrobiaceae bacterium]|nr:hypothetical protein [Ancalomicrobiaceae bacterium]